LIAIFFDGSLFVPSKLRVIAERRQARETRPPPKAVPVALAAGMQGR
jgi:hypothetical protein